MAVALAGLDPAERDAHRAGACPGSGRRVLEELDRPALEGELREACGCSGGVVAELVRKGVLRRFQQGRQGLPRRWELAPPAPPEHLTSHQERVVASLLKDIGGGEYRATLLLGVTGSGKTEVYLRLVAAAAARGLQALVLVPEIALTPALAGQLAGTLRRARRGASLLAWPRGSASPLGSRARRGEVDVVAGPRSALWAPLHRLGVIVVDEEQDASYKQEEEPRYTRVTSRLLLGQRCSGAGDAGLGDALPRGARAGGSRVGCRCSISPSGWPAAAARGRGGGPARREPPEPGEHGQRFLSRRLSELLEQTVARGEQAILLVNRRGWAPVLLCRECGHQATCPNCSIPLTVHRRQSALLCHYCGSSARDPAGVPALWGGGARPCRRRHREDRRREVRELLRRHGGRHPRPRHGSLAGAARSPRSSVSLPGPARSWSAPRWSRRATTFPHVTLTGVVNADNLLGFPDFRGAERTFHMLTQVAGRAGRGERPGTVVIQTYHPDHHALRAAVTHDVKGFAEEELRYRKAFRYPPATRGSRWCASSLRTRTRQRGRAGGCPRHRARAAGAARRSGRRRRRWRGCAASGGPPAAARSDRAPLREACRVVAIAVPHHVRRVIDVDPQSTV